MSNELANKNSLLYTIDTDNHRKALEVAAVVRFQEREKERNFIMRWEKDPEDPTVKRWVKVRPRTEAEIRKYDRQQKKK